MLRKRDMKDGLAIWWWIVMAAFGLVIATTMMLAYKPVWLGLERAAYKQSHQYVEAKETMLLQWIEEYQSLEVEVAEARDLGKDTIADAMTGQQAALLSRIRQEADRVKPDALPLSVREFLRKHGE